jgi:xanthine dehydrogenase YagS FAD-binding subunit
MKAFRYLRPRSLAAAADALVGNASSVLHAGGVDLLDRLKERLDGPDALVALLDVPGQRDIVVQDDGSIRLGGGVTLAMLAADEVVARFLPSLADAARHAASPAIRHRATIAGNLAQHTRCGYYRLATLPCLKRGGDLCPVREATGVQDTAGVFGNGTCASAHPSSLAPVLGALEAHVRLVAPEAEREVPLATLWRTPAPGVAADLALEAGEVIQALVIPPHGAVQRVAYTEVRQKQAFDWALVSCAVRLAMDGERVRDAHIVLGSVAPTPWRATAAEEVLAGQPLDAARIARAAKAATQGATPLPGTAYKVRLVEVVVRRALEQAQAPQGGAR